MKILFLTHRLPYAPNRGDRSRAYHLLREMARFAEVSLFSLTHDRGEAGHVGNVPFAHDVTAVRVSRVRNLLRGALSLAGAQPLTHALLDAPRIRGLLGTMIDKRRPDVIIAYCSSMARFALEPPLTALPLVIDMVDVDSAKWQLMAERSRGPRRWVYRREARTLGAFEALACRAAFATVVVNERERATLQALAPDARVLVLQNGIDLEAFRPVGEPTPDAVVIFCGVMNYYPNEEGVLWFGEHVWPLIRAARPDARFVVVGSAPTNALRRLSARDPSITVTGHVASVQPYLQKAAVSVAPLRLARGIQTKVIEALASGLPVVVTPAVMAGLPPEAEPGCQVADTADGFAQAVLALLARSPGERRQKAADARLGGLAWTERSGFLKDLVVEAAKHPRCSIA